MTNALKGLLGMGSAYEKGQGWGRTLLKGSYRLMGAVTLFSMLSTGIASASSIYGKVRFVGTISEDGSTGNYSARLRVAVRGTCDSDPTVQDRWVIIRSGRSDGLDTHNAVNMRNAYSTFLSALLSGNSVQIDGTPNCSTTTPIFLDLWNGSVGLFIDVPTGTLTDPGTALHPVTGQ